MTVGQIEAAEEANRNYHGRGGHSLCRAGGPNLLEPWVSLVMDWEKPKGFFARQRWIARHRRIFELEYQLGWHAQNDYWFLDKLDGR